MIDGLVPRLGAGVQKDADLRVELPANGIE
jgi:hypothetical protein